jgi:hypothetical protein
MEILRIADKFSGILSVANVRAKANDFLVDRLSYKFTVGILCLFAVLCGLKTSYAVPIICWIPAQLRRYERAITAYCYANNTYYVPDDRRIPSTANERYEALIIYYQWLVRTFFLFERMKFLFFVLISHGFLVLKPLSVIYRNLFGI